MKSKKIIIISLMVLIICISVICVTLFILKPKKENDIKNTVREENKIEESNESIENYLLNSNILNKEIFESQNEFDLNSTGADWMYSEEIAESTKNVLEETRIEEPNWKDTVTEEDINNYQFKIIYENMPESTLDYINKAFENFDKTLKEYVYVNGFAAASEARYSYDRMIESANSITIFFNLNDYYESIIGVLINLDDYSSEIQDI